ncbi:MAG TPA: TIGR03936 family radical SAM-associated protein [Dehalococcoidia bacterium]|nr:TIGR03936 family radical SAM-associated protein [Dehalococcoidia bacterium]
MSAKVQRLRVSYRRGPAARFISHLDIMRFWERALRRAHVPVSYSEGFTPHAQIALAAPLSIGQTSDCELLDLFLAERWEPEQLRQRLQMQLPPSMDITHIEEVEVGAPSLQSTVRAAEYALRLAPDTDVTALQQRIDAFLTAASVPWEHRRDKDVKRYDLRPLVESLELRQGGAGAELVALLRAEEGGTARPDQVAAALGLSERLDGVHRVRLLLAETEHAGA